MSLIIRRFGQCNYMPAYQAMMEFSRCRDSSTVDEIWILQHNPVYTLGLAGKMEHVLAPGKIPVIKTDRGGQVTYHGPGQLLIYVLIDLKRRKISIKGLVDKLEQSILDLLHELELEGNRKAGAPGVYIKEKKIAALGIRVRNGCSYHGISLNVDMDLSPFNGINPCGYPGLEVTSLKTLGINMNVNRTAERILPYLFRHLDYDPDTVEQVTQTELFNEYKEPA